jgi:2-polyprenyl-6-hydroxyphenyl methylase/3-demethylubiquinone-9 3-methyltransferase
MTSQQTFENFSQNNQETTNQNVDWSEVHKFEALAERWWDTDSEFKPLHDINPLRLNYIIQQSGGSIAGKKIIDVGCGGGILAESLSAKGAEVIGIDAGEANIAVANIHAKSIESSVQYQQITAEEIAAQQTAQYDIVTCLEMLEHVPDPSSVIEACATLVKPGGYVFFSTINRTAKAYAFAVIGAEYILKMLPKGTHDYRKFLKPDEIDDAAVGVDLKLSHTIGMHYNPLTQSYWLDKGLDVNYLACYVKNQTGAVA